MHYNRVPVHCAVFSLAQGHAHLTTSQRGKTACDTAEYPLHDQPVKPACKGSLPRPRPGTGCVLVLEQLHGIRFRDSTLVVNQQAASRN